MKYTVWAALLFQTLAGAASESTAARYYEALRSDNLHELRNLIGSSGPGVKDSRENTPLIHAAAAGSVEAMRALLKAGADVNAANAFGFTALMACPSDLNKVRLLVEKGAAVNAVSKQGRTALMLAADVDGNSEVVRYLIEKGAKHTLRDQFQYDALMLAAFSNDTASARLLLARGADAKAKNVAGETALMSAAGHGNTALVRLLLEKGADVNAVTAPQFGPGVKNGPVALGLFTPLILAAANGGAETVKLLLDAGANVNARDVRGLTPLMLAIALDRPDPETVRLLISGGADKSARSKAGETALDWARKFRNTAVLAAMGERPDALPAAPRPVPASARTAPDARTATARALTLLERTSAGFFKEGGCVACHAQNAAGFAAAAGRRNGFAIDEKAVAEDIRATRLQWASQEATLLQRFDPPGGPDQLVYALFHLAEAGAPADRTTDAMVHNLVAQQWSGGQWHLDGVARPPMEDGDFSRTAMAIRGLRIYGPPGRRAEMDARILRAVEWLSKNEPRTTEDRVMQALGFQWAGAKAGSLEARKGGLLGLQREDGGWAQTPELESDAYATGMTLYALHELGLASSDTRYRRGVEFLLKTQFDDGSWHVVSRAPKFQPYFQSGFPHDHDQWISAAATAWAAAALSNAAPDKAVAAIR